MDPPPHRAATNNATPSSQRVQPCGWGALLDASSVIHVVAYTSGSQPGIQCMHTPRPAHLDEVLIRYCGQQEPPIMNRHNNRRINARPP